MSSVAILTPTVRVVDANGAPVTGDGGNLSLTIITDGVESVYAGAVTEVGGGEYSVVVTQNGTLQSVVGTSSTEGVIVIPARWYNSAAAGDKMDFVDSPNVTAVTALQSGLAQTGGDSDTLETLSDQIDGISGGSGAHSVTLYVKDDSANPVAGAAVTIPTAGTRSTVASTGAVLFNLDTGTYSAVVRSSIFYTPEESYTVIVDADGNVTSPTGGILEVTAVTLPEYTPGKALVYSYEKDPQGDSVVGAAERKVYVVSISEDTAFNADTAAHYMALSRKGDGVDTDAAGSWTMNLPLGAEVIIEIYDVTTKKSNFWKIKTPSTQGTYNFWKLAPRRVIHYT